MFGKVLSSAVLGIDAYTVEVEAHLENTTPAKFFTVGLAEGAVKESKERVLAAMKNSGFRIPSKRITVNLAPADIRKEGSAFWISECELRNLINLKSVPLRIFEIQDIKKGGNIILSFY